MPGQLFTLLLVLIYMLVPENIGIAALIFIVGYLGYIVYYAIGLYQWNPLVRPKPLTLKEKVLLKANFPMYSRLPKQYIKKCDERIVWFRSKKKFVFYGDVAKKQELQLVLCATLVFMTLGLRQYKMVGALLRIIIYPTQYYSRIRRRHHLGEYNPRFKTAIFSADKIWEGFAIPDDNINLAVHEFAHALSFEMLRKRSWEARRFRVGLKKIKELFEVEHFRRKLVASQYFRDYGMTNLQEFFSVAVENYFETPSSFHNDFPKLFYIIQRMLNFDYEISCVFDPLRKIPGS